jgi:Fe-S-cluster containining protein
VFEKYYNKLRFSQKMADRSLITCMEIMESNRNKVLSSMKSNDVYCKKGCNLCCHMLTLTVDTLNTYILSRIFQNIPYNELFPIFKLCIDNRIIVQEYIDSIPLDSHINIPLEVYNKFGFTGSTCPFVGKQNECLIYGFRPQMCFTYFSSIPCKISFNPTLNENQKIPYKLKGDGTQNIDVYGLENDCLNYYFDDNTLKTYEKFDLKKAIKQDQYLAEFFAHSYSFEMLAIVSLALETSNPVKYENDMKGINYDFLAYVDGEIKKI